MDWSPSLSSTRSSRFNKRNYEKFKLEGLNRKGPSCPCPARAPAGTTAAAARLRGTRRTCPFRCGSLCLARRGFWIAGFIPTRLGSSPLTFPSCSRLATSLLS